MHRFVKEEALCVMLLMVGSSAFVAPRLTSPVVAFSTTAPRTSRVKVYSSPDEGDDKDDEIERLKSMAAKLRAEAAALEAKKQQELADVAQKAFQKFDTNKDGEVSLKELKDGLEKKLKMELSESRVKALMEAFDTSGDGALQLDEFVGVDQFRNKLEALVRDEQELARQAAKKAQKEAEEAILAEARLNILNERPPTNADKVISVVPYLLPLLDGLQFGRFLLPGESENPAVVALAVLYSLYRSVPFGGIIAFVALNFLSGNPSQNKLVRFNAQQAIFVDIALFFPSIIYSLYSLVFATGLGLQIPPSVTEIGTDAVFVSLLAVLAYCVVSSLLGITPDKIPLISKSVSDRMPTIDSFDDQGRFIGRGPEENDDKKDDKKDE